MRFLSNPSSGKMGFALARAAQELGAETILIAGPVSLETPEGVRRIDVVTAQEMLEVCSRHFANCDVFIATAAVGDYFPVEKASRKLKKSGEGLILHLRQTPDILKTLAAKKRKGQVVVGFAAETHDVAKHARKKLLEKNLDLIVANDVSSMDRGFAVEQNAALLIDRTGTQTTVPLRKKSALAEDILTKVKSIISNT